MFARPAWTGNRSGLAKAALIASIFGKKIGAGEEIRTLDPNLGKVVLYH
jgi:hypothetical protein